MPGCCLDNRGNKVLFVINWRHVNQGFNVAPICRKKFIGVRSDYSDGQAIAPTPGQSVVRWPGCPNHWTPGQSGDRRTGGEMFSDPSYWNLTNGISGSFSSRNTVNMHNARPNVDHKALLVVAVSRCSMRVCFCPSMAVLAVEKSLVWRKHNPWKTPLRKSRASLYTGT